MIVSSEAMEKVLREKLRISLILFRKTCMGCGQCNHACPVSGVIGMKNLSPLKRIEAAERVLYNKNVSQEDVDVLFSCLLCGACSIACPYGIDVYRIVFLARSLAALYGFAPRDLDRITNGAINTHHSFGSSIDEANRWLDLMGEDAPVDKKGSEILYVPSPVETAFLPKHAAETGELLNKIGVSWTVSTKIADGGGNVAIDCSRPDVGLAILNRLLEVAEELRVKKIALGACGSDYKWIMLAKELFPDLIKRKNHVMFTSIYSVLSSRLKSLGERKEAVLHDPCSMTRYINVMDKYRGLLSCPIQPSRSGVYTLCCGGSGGLSLRKDSLARSILLQISSMRLKELASAGKTVVTPCIKCYITFKMALLRSKLDIDVVGLSSYLVKEVVKKNEG